MFLRGNIYKITENAAADSNTVRLTVIYGDFPGCPWRNMLSCSQLNSDLVQSGVVMNETTDVTVGVCDLCASRHFGPFIG